MRTAVSAVAVETFAVGLDDKFASLWRDYLMYCKGGVKGGGINIAQATSIKR
jgi:cyclopropane-fatty-acyl-phospholipid synthase